MSRVEGKMHRAARVHKEAVDSAWWEKWWADLCPTPEDKVIREWAYEFYGLSGVEQPIEYLRKAKKAIEEKGYYIEEEDG